LRTKACGRKWLEMGALAPAADAAAVGTLKLTGSTAAKTISPLLPCALASRAIPHRDIGLVKKPDVTMELAIPAVETPTFFNSRPGSIAFAAGKTALTSTMKTLACDPAIHRATPTARGGSLVDRVAARRANGAETLASPLVGVVAVGDFLTHAYVNPVYRRVPRRTGA